METQKVVYTFIDALVVFSSEWLIPMMMFLFIAGMVFRGLIYYTVKREEWFAKEFEKRVDIYLKERDLKLTVSFYVTCKKLLEKTFYDLFKVRFIMKRRKPDHVMAFADRVFLIKQGSAILVEDFLKQLKHLRYNEANHPRLLSTTKKIFSKNPCYSKVFGIFPAATMNDVVNILPGIFIVMGVFGTFLGIMRGLPDLGNMDLADIEASKMVMDQFLVKIAFSMSTSLIGIALSVIFSIFNATLSPEKLFISAVERMETALDTIWHLSANNDVPSNLVEFDENRNPEEVLAQQAVNEELMMARNKNKEAS
jgi:hypothetical protein